MMGLEFPGIVHEIIQIGVWVERAASSSSLVCRGSYENVFYAPPPPPCGLTLGISSQMKVHCTSLFTLSAKCHPASNCWWGIPFLSLFL